MSDTDPRFIPRPIAILSALLAILAALTIGIVAFLLPAHRIRRDYTATTCTAIHATLACSGACRNLTVVSSDFAGTAFLLRTGRRAAPCASAAACKEMFACRFRLQNGRAVVREAVSAFPKGMILFVSIAGVILVCLLVYLLQIALKAFGIDVLSATPIQVVLFVPPGVDAVALVGAVRARWPRVEARALSYRMYIREEGKVAVDAARAFQTPAKKGAGLVFIVSADGRNEGAVLDAVPESFYRVLVIPSLEDCLQAACAGIEGTQDARLQQGSQADETLARSVSSRADSAVADREVRAACLSLEEMASQFDSVYSVGAWEFGSHSWIAVRALSPYVPLRVGIVSFAERVKIGVGQASNRTLEFLCCWRNEPDTPA